MPYRKFSVFLTRAEWSMIVALLQKELAFCGQCTTNCKESCYYNLTHSLESIKSVIDSDSAPYYSLRRDPKSGWPIDD